jgi:CO/xanthine dehydrogenase Mo-binding subunit
MYGEDLAFDGALWVTFLRSTMAHARTASIDAKDCNAIGLGVVARRERASCPRDGGEVAVRLS